MFNYIKNTIKVMEQEDFQNKPWNYFKLEALQRKHTTELTATIRKLKEKQARQLY